jgi:hypothetical protein
MLAAALLVAIVGGGAASYVALVRPLFRSSPASRPSAPSNIPSTSFCPTVRLPHAARLGVVVWIDAGALMVFDLGTCRQAVPVTSGVEPPVRFSPDGHWLGFGDGRVVPVAGGTVEQPFGQPVQAWAWSPAANLLAGVTAKEGVLITQPGGRPEMLLPDDSGVRHLAFSPDGRRLAVDRVATGIQVLDVTTAEALTIFRQPDPARVPEVAGWSPDGQWILYWRGPIGQAASPLDAAPARGGAWVNVFDPMLRYRDFLSPCGNRIAATAGGDQEVSVGKQILLSGAPAWRFHNLTHDYTRSWIWPACSPDGRWVAAVAMPNHHESPDSAGPRALWLLAADGSSRRRLIPGGDVAPEFPRWSRDAQVMLVVFRAGGTWSSRGSLVLVQVDPKSAAKVRIVGAMIDLDPAPGPGGHQEWSAISDWYQPA